MKYKNPRKITIGELHDVIKELTAVELDYFHIAKGT